MTETNGFCVVFDLGGVLVHVAHKWGDALDQAQVAPGRPEAVHDVLEAFDEFLTYQAGVTTDDSYLDALTRFLGIEDPGSAFRVHQSILTQPYAGTSQMVEELHTLGYRTGCLSNTNAPHWAALLDPERYPAIAALQTPAASHLMGLDKPDHRIYRAYEALIGAAPENIAFFDDNAANIAAARELGWKAFLKSPEAETPAAVWHALGGLGWPIHPASASTSIASSIPSGS